MDFIGTQSHGLTHIAEYPIEDVLAGHYRTHITIDGTTYNIKQESLRYKTFAKSTVCCCCGLVGTHMLLDARKRGNSAHFNLYAEWDGRLVLMTKDHVIPRSKGGPEHIDNMRTMCETCNGVRGNLDVTLDELYEMVGELSPVGDDFDVDYGFPTRVEVDAMIDELATEYEQSQTSEQEG